MSMNQPASPDLHGAHETERHLLCALGEVRDQPGFSVCRTPAFPGYYDGNTVHIQRAADRDLDAWIALFHAHFDPEVHRHVNLGGLDGSGIDALEEPARAAGFSVAHLGYLVATAAPGPDDAPDAPDARDAARGSLPPDLVIRRVDSEARWQLLYEFDHDEHRSEPWFTAAAGEMMFAKKRLLSERARIDWLYISPAREDRMLARLGLFEVTLGRTRACRLQDVGTAAEHRRHGLATALLREAQREALVRRHAAGLYVQADVADVAIHLYRALGFADLGTWTRLLRVHS